MICTFISVYTYVALYYTNHTHYIYAITIYCRYIRSRDIDQDGLLSVPDFVSSFANQLDPLSRIRTTNTIQYTTNNSKSSSGSGGVSSNDTSNFDWNDISPLAISFGMLQILTISYTTTNSTTTNNNSSVLPYVTLHGICDTLLFYMTRIIQQPDIPSFFKISGSGQPFSTYVLEPLHGYNDVLDELMKSIGFYKNTASSSGGSSSSSSVSYSTHDVISNKPVLGHLSEMTAKVLTSRVKELRAYLANVDEISVSSVLTGMCIQVYSGVCMLGCIHALFLSCTNVYPTCMPILTRSLYHHYTYTIYCICVCYYIHSLVRLSIASITDRYISDVSSVCPRND